MAIQPLHARITRSAMKQLGFSQEAIQVAERANVKVDEKQGNFAAEANLHSMCGITTSNWSTLGLRLQSQDECKEAVRELLEDAKKAIAKKAADGSFQEALKALGAALHTVQDREFHKFEPWPHAGILEAIQKDPNYMFAHAVRDLGHVSQMGFSSPGAGRPQFNLGLSFELGSKSWLTFQGFAGPSLLSRGSRFARPVGSDEGFGGSGGMISISFGAAPGSLPRRHTAATPDLPIQQSTELQRILTTGPDAKARAEKATLQFILEVKKEVPARAWEEFLQGGG